MTRTRVAVGFGDGLVEVAADGEGGAILRLDREGGGVDAVGHENALLELLGLFEVLPFGLADERVADPDAQKAAQGQGADRHDQQHVDDSTDGDAKAEGEE